MKIHGWIVPPPKEPSKSKQDFTEERFEKVRWLIRHGYLASEHLTNAMLTIPREEFTPMIYRDYAYREVPIPLPGENATMSCPHSYPLFYEPLGLEEGHRFLEIGLGSGYGAALAREIVGKYGLVVSVEIDPETFAYAKNNLVKTGFHDVILVQGDGGFGYPDKAPYDRICITAACSQVPPPLIEQLKTGGRLIAPLLEGDVQNLLLFNKGVTGFVREVVSEVLYVTLKGTYGSDAE